MPHVATAQTQVAYHEMLALAKAKFKERLPRLPKVCLKQNQRSNGLLCFPEVWNLCQEVGREIFFTRNYEMPYNQLCRAFFDMAEEHKLIEYID